MCSGGRRVFKGQVHWLQYRMEFSRRTYSHLFLTALGLGLQCSCPLQVTVFLQVTPISLLTHQAALRSFFWSKYLSIWGECFFVSPAKATQQSGHYKAGLLVPSQANTGTNCGTDPDWHKLCSDSWWYSQTQPHTLEQSPLCTQGSLEPDSPMAMNAS